MQPSRLLLAACVALALLSCVCVAQIDKSDKASPEQSLFRSLYTKIEEMVLPPYNSERGAPNAVILFEMPGLAINRDEYDTNIWAAGGFNSRQPEAVAASFVDRLPYYTGATFVDSGSRISAVWSNFIYQYIIPIVDDPIQVQKVNEARGALANGTLTNTYNAASASYQATFSQFVTFRSNCLARQPGGVCSAEGVIYRELLKRKWFSLEVARRDIAAAEAKIIALQVQDLKNIFADALYAFASNERVDMGGAGFGTNYYLTFLTPSNFWRWWPTTGIYDHSVYADGSTVAFTLEPGASIVRNPVFGALTTLVNGSYSYRPNAGYTGSDTYVYQVTKPVGGTNVTSTITRSIQVIGNDVLAADTAFVSVTATASYTEQTDKSFSSSLSTSSSFRAGFGMFSASGSLSTSSTSTETSSESLARDSSISFDLAKVSISRPWLDISLLSFYPVAIRNLVAQGWSDGTLTPASSATRFKFKLLPTAFLVARKIVIKSSFSQKMQQLNQQASSLDASLKVSVGPFFSGSTSVSSDSASREYKESSTTTAGSVSIRGPQVIGWLCTPVPPFPTSDEAGVRKWEADQIARQDAANKSTASGSSSGTGTTTTTAAGTTTAGTTATTAGTTTTPATATATR